MPQSRPDDRRDDDPDPSDLDAPFTAGHRFGRAPHAGRAGATGGGAILNADSRRHLGSRGVVIYLRARITTQLARTRGSSRPLLQAADPAARLQQLLDERAPLYESLADLCVDTEDGNPDRLAAELADRLQHTEGMHHD